MYKVLPQAKVHTSRKQAGTFNSHLSRKHSPAQIESRVLLIVPFFAYREWVKRIEIYNLINQRRMVSP